MSPFLLFLVLQADPRRAIQAQYDAWSKAYMARDAETLIGILSPDYTLTGSNKKPLAYDVYVAKLRLMKETPADPTRYSTHIKKLTERGDEADVVSVETMETDTVDPKTKRPALSLHRHEYLDTWIHYDAGWRLRRTVTRREWTDISPKRVH
ncbi:nuclear transport factor 2 family protein [Fimbriimonas ginsengisoli]|uniref:DUF4440 domain-containing protein n=1 Tax=Fimbriimonas ginsengisoli Gsoil 348 TaxID=661478 RepID=A0A068NWV2_FIMGI|nr:nuclear transport factor 2 family protein [Fimbriimonas ginsengisoli]AIE87852.1 hypothetical protein OP10G_4484 [Fimbriimonas ginsengisoli Gsoil 348]